MSFPQRPLNPRGRNRRAAPRRNNNALARVQNQLASMKLDLRMSSVRLRQIYDPPVYNDSATYNRTVRLLGNATATVTPAALYAAIFSTATGFNVTIKVTSISAWTNASADATIDISISETVATSGPPVSIYNDYGTQGAKRPSIHLQWSREVREIWFPSAATNTLAVVSTNQTGAASVITDVRMQFRITGNSV